MGSPGPRALIPSRQKRCQPRNKDGPELRKRARQRRVRNLVAESLCSGPQSIERRGWNAVAKVGVGSSPEALSGALCWAA